MRLKFLVLYNGWPVSPKGTTSLAMMSSGFLPAQKLLTKVEILKWTQRSDSCFNIDARQRGVLFWISIKNGRSIIVTLMFCQPDHEEAWCGEARSTKMPLQCNFGSRNPLLRRQQEMRLPYSTVTLECNCHSWGPNPVKYLPTERQAWLSAK